MVSPLIDKENNDNINFVYIEEEAQDNIQPMGLGAAEVDYYKFYFGASVVEMKNIEHLHFNRMNTAFYRSSWIF